MAEDELAQVRAQREEGRRSSPFDLGITEGSAAAASAVKARFNTLAGFVKARLTEAGSSPSDFMALGYALGRAEAAVDYSDVAGVAQYFTWIDAQAARWKDHPDYPPDEYHGE